MQSTQTANALTFTISWNHFVWLYCQKHGGYALAVRGENHMGIYFDFECPLCKRERKGAA